MDLIILAMDNVIFQDLDLLLTIISLILNTFHVLKKWMEENFYYSRDIQHKILNDILKCRQMLMLGLLELKDLH
ncbi:hypothetical protein BANRA_01181 [Escherichia coli]|nr:hypothetical protein BANRA_01181 [Escherichia coli]